MLQQQPAAGLDVRRSPRHDQPQVAQPVVAGGQRQCRLVHECCQVRIGSGDVRRVAQHQIKPPPGQRVPPRALCELHRQRQSRRVVAGQLQGVGAEVGGGHARLRLPVLDGQRDGARAGAEIDHRGRATAGLRRPRCQPLQRPVDQQLGVGPRHQHTRVDLQHQAVKFFFAQQVGERLAGGAASGQRIEGPGLRGVKQRFAVRQQPAAALGQQPRQQQLCIQQVDAAASRLRDGLCHADWHHAKARPALRPLTTRRFPAQPVARPIARPAVPRSRRPARRPGSAAACTASG